MVTNPRTENQTIKTETAWIKTKILFSLSATDRNDLQEHTFN